MTHDELEELLGVYALDALDDDERREVDDHLSSCPRCRAELASYREVAAMLGNSAADTPAAAPDELWDRISASLLDEPPVLSPLHRSRRQRAGWIVPLGAVAAALIIVVGLLVAKVINLDHQVSALSSEAGVAKVISDPSHQTVELTSTTKPWRATVVLLDGQGYLINPSMPSLGRSQTFQLWALSRGKVVSLGVLGATPSAAALRVEPNMTVLMITAEPLGGTPVPTTPVLVRGDLPVGV
ncbi:MAG: anti-sigma factor [Acidimicrobiales bacterium]|jgi:predicted anti-sigma-YlaC factor YlaD